MENPSPKTICVRGLELFEEIISGYQSQSMSYIIYQYHISISISGYQSQWERSDYALPQENWKGREVRFSSNSNHICCLDPILVVIITEGASAINSIFQYIDQYL